MAPERNTPQTPAVVLVTDSLKVGGAERVLCDMANYWAARGWRVTFATWSGAQTEDFYSLGPGIERVWLDVRSSGDSLVAKLRANVARIFRLRRLLVARRPDAVVSFIEVSNILTLLAAFGLRTRIAISERGCHDPIHDKSARAWAYSVSRYWQLLRRLLYRRANVVTALNKDTAQWISEECGVPVRVIPVALRSLPQATARKESMVLAVGRFHPVKGFDLLLRAFARLTGEFPDWRLVLIGEGPQKPQLMELCGELQLQKQIEFVEPQRNVELWMDRAGVIVLPSRSEAFGNVVLESLAMGVPVISTRCHGPASLIDDDVNGRLVPVEDIDALTQSMRELMAQPDLRRRLGQEAIKVRQCYRQEAVMTQWESCLFPQTVEYK